MDKHPELQQADQVQLNAWNGAFWDLGFRWQWDAGTYRELRSLADDKARLAAYVERHQPHLLRAYERDFLVGLIHSGMERRRAAILNASSRGEPPHLTCNGMRGN